MSKKKFQLPDELKSPSNDFQEASRQIGLFWWHWYPGEEKIAVDPQLLLRIGISPEEFDHRTDTLYAKVHPDDVPKTRKRYEELLAGENELYEVEYRIREQGGGWKWYYNRGVVSERDASGQPVGIGGITIDISGEFQHLLTMVEEKDKFEFIFRNSTEAALIFEFQEGKIESIRDANQAAIDLFGLQQSGFTQRLPEQFKKDEMRDAAVFLLAQIREKGMARLEKRISVPDKGFRWLEISAHQFSLTEEDLILAIFSDKTYSKKTEAALRETERLYRVLFEAANDRIGLFSREGKPLLLNEAFHDTIGYTREEYMAMNNQEPIHPDDRKRLDRERQELFLHGSSGHEYRVRHKQGHYMHMSSKAVLIPGEQGEGDMVLLVIRDITDRKRFIEELEDAKQAAEESNKLKSAFLANMSHEIRTPMNSIVGFSNLLTEEHLGDEVRRSYVDRIVRNSELLLALISDIVDLAKIESGQLPLIYGRLKVAELLEEMKNYAEDELKRFDNRQLDVIMQQEDKDVELEIDTIRISQIMKNLINNAIKFTDRGSVSIGAKSYPEENRIVFHVRDTGIGIDSDHFGLIFEQFRQVDGSDTRRYGGTGLGLTICRKLARMMGGRIWVESVSGEGALFQVELPIRTTVHQSSIEQEALTEPASTEVSEELSIMVVDDEPDSADLLEALVSSMGHRVVKVPNGYEALKYLEQSTLPDIVMLDVEMSVLKGADVLRIIRERYRNIRVIAQSAHALHGDRNRFMEEGYDGYLPKPYSVQQLSEVISSLVLNP
jgi:PAS domain S-box-containing protein